MTETLDSLRTLYLDSLCDLFDAERQNHEALKRLEAAAFSKELRKAIGDHAERTCEQVSRLETLFEDLESAPDGRECQAMTGLVREADRLAALAGDPYVRDAALITAVQRVEHYEIAGYGCARTFARLLRLDDHAELLQTTLEEEAELDELLTDLAETMINQRAAESHTRAFLG